MAKLFREERTAVTSLEKLRENSVIVLHHFGFKTAAHIMGPFSGDCTVPRSSWQVAFSQQQTSCFTQLSAPIKCYVH